MVNGNVKTENGKVKAWIKQAQCKLLAYCTRAIENWLRPQ